MGVVILKNGKSRKLRQASSEILREVDKISIVDITFIEKYCVVFFYNLL